MKCQKCPKQAVIHLTEIISDPMGAKRAVEIHLCLGHAAEAGIIAPGSEILPQVMSSKSLSPSSKKPEPELEAASPTAIVPAPGNTGGLVVSRSKEGDPAACPMCGLTWSNFKQNGLMGCSHDYTMFETKLLPLLKRAHEGATDHAGKIPAARKTEETNRHVNSLRIRRELQKAIDAENYEQAARLRDELRQIEHN
jgi:protein arginine kinase activator